MVVQNQTAQTAQTGRYSRVIGVFQTRAAAERAIDDIKAAGIDMERVSVVAKDADEVSGVDTGLNSNRKHEADGNHADDGATTGAITGGAIGGIGGLLVGLGTLAIPGIGPILLAGAEATAIATTLAGGAIGAAAGGLVGALIGLGIPEEDARAYNDRVVAGHYLVMVNSYSADVQQAEAILRRHNAEEVKVYDSPGSALDNPENIKLYEERLKVHKERARAGEVAIGKRVETESAQVAVPVTKEKLVVERSEPTTRTPATATSDAFRSGEVARVELYEENADVRKEAFVREEVNVRKETERETVSGEATVRREELDIDTNGTNVVRR
ncbi:MAG: DUF2382 domain-containing protein [Cyanobacteria bacterium P01_D01_bin.1]